ncbi:MAG: hypothetical protein M3O28_04940 [Actinomycetota bacterium]|nr:hypothetical protein [Actinomycetota bacterium]
MIDVPEADDDELTPEDDLGPVTTGDEATAGADAEPEPTIDLTAEPISAITAHADAAGASTTVGSVGAAKKGGSAAKRAPSNKVGSDTKTNTKTESGQGGKKSGKSSKKSAPDPTTEKPADTTAPRPKTKKSLEPDTPAVGTTRRHGIASVRLVWVSAVAGLLILALVAALLVVLAKLSHQKDVVAAQNALVAARRDASAAGQKIAVDFSSYNYSTIEKDFAAVAMQLTPDYAKSYLSTSKSLEATIVKYQAIAKGQVLSTGIATATTSQATLVLFIDQTFTSTQTKTPTVQRNRVVMTLVNQQGHWLASDLQLK